MWDQFQGRLLSKQAAKMSAFITGGSDHMGPLRGELQDNLKVDQEMVKAFMKLISDKYPTATPTDIVISIAQRLWSCDPPDLERHLKSATDIFGHLQASLQQHSFIDKWTILLSLLDEGTKRVPEHASNPLGALQLSPVDNIDSLPILYRAMVPPGDLTNAQAWKKWADRVTGQRVAFPTIISASQDKLKMETFSLQVEAKDHFAILQLHGVPNASGLIDSEWPAEKEVIIPFGSVFTVEGISWDGTYPQVILKYCGLYNAQAHIPTGETIENKARDTGGNEEDGDFDGYSVCSDGSDSLDEDELAYTAERSASNSGKRKSTRKSTHKSNVGASAAELGITVRPRAASIMRPLADVSDLAEVEVMLMEEDESTSEASYEPPINIHQSH
eukprot:TRINITY_DN66877_c8_g1_i1.p1 TRINITY_DN66877_c8_g1~~TRINITY_DN66877_c8_g1_i1.p1  ORF type:complete len:452 (-),score=39.36 TRINITY_DN66877_c8_g1_i1:483-1646(-)